jgi:RNA polymerase sigma factor (sigma-70 family)
MSSVTRSAVLRPIYRLFDEGTLVGSSDAELLERFVARGDERAFEALVTRHGRSVQAVCRDVLRDPHDAEDAFQATFLILARKAGSLWVRNSLAAWLHRVAHRVAVEANRQKVRRRAVEKTGLDLDPVRTDASTSWGSLPQALHEEIDQLPEKYRAPIILCDLEELSRDEAAHRLGWPAGTVAGRLARARSLLRDRLIRRGHSDVGGLMAIAHTRCMPHGGVLASWSRKTAQILTTSPGSTMKTTGLASLGSTVLARGVIRAMMLAKLKTIAVVLIVAGAAPAILALAMAKTRLETTPGGAELAFQANTPGQASADASKTAPGKVPVTGTIVFLDGTPAKDARVFFSTRDDVSGDGRVRAETGADAQGRFSLEITPAEGVMAGFPGTGMLWAYRPGSLIAFVPVFRGALPPGLPQRLVLGPPAHTVFEVRGPDGKPVVGARIEPHSLNSHHALVPDGLASLMGASAVTDARGRAVMTALFPEEISWVRVVSENHGQQEFRFSFQELIPEPRVLSLQPVGRLKGRLVGEPDAVRRRPLSVCGFSPPGELDGWSFLQDITTDDDGRFDIPAIVVGPHGVKTVPRSDLPWYASTEGLVDVKPGQTTEVVLPLKRAIRVGGLVREKGSEKPIRGVRVGVTIVETAPMTTGPDGRYEGYAPPEVTFLRPWSVPAGYAMPIFSLPQEKVPENVVEFPMPPLELMRAGEVRGLVVDEHARPVAGAEVEASWNLDETGQGTGPHRLTARTGPDGRFVVDRVPEGVEVALSANYRGFCTPEPRVSRVGEASILRLTHRSGVSLEGRVLDPAGRPVVRAYVHLRSPRRNGPYGPITGSEQVEFEGGSILVTDADGRFRTPKELNSDVEYAAYASAAGFRSSRTYWTRGGLRVFTDMKLQPETEATPKSPD